MTIVSLLIIINEAYKLYAYEYKSIILNCFAIACRESEGTHLLTEFYIESMISKWNLNNDYKNMLLCGRKKS